VGIKSFFFFFLLLLLYQNHIKSVCIQMERSLTIELPVEQVAKVVKRHLVYQPGSSSSLIPPRPSRNKHLKQQHKGHKRAETTSTYSKHHLLSGGAILDEIYKWTAKVEHKQQKRTRTQSISLPAIREPTIDISLQSLKQPGGFRRYFVLNKAAKQGKNPPNFVTGSFVEFLCLYGHFGGENLSDVASSEEEEYSSSEEDSGSDEEEIPEGSIAAYNGSPLNNASYVSYGSMNNASSSAGLPLPASASNSKTAVEPLQFKQLQEREAMPLLSRVKPGQTFQGKATPGKAMFLLLKSFVTTGKSIE
jgi:proton-coupled amino acid transporter